MAYIDHLVTIHSGNREKMLAFFRDLTLTSDKVGTISTTDKEYKTDYIRIFYQVTVDDDVAEDLQDEIAEAKRIYNQDPIKLEQAGVTVKVPSWLSVV